MDEEPVSNLANMPKEKEISFYSVVPEDPYLELKVILQPLGITNIPPEKIIRFLCGLKPAARDDENVNFKAPLTTTSS